MSSPVEILANRVIGIVENVSAKIISVRIDLSAPHATALNTGTPMGFPRINGYLLIPNEYGTTVCTITSVRIEKQADLKSRETRNTALVNLPLATRIATLTPLGTLVLVDQDKFDNQIFRLRRGIDVFPSVGDTVLLPTDIQLQAVVEGEDSDFGGRIRIGKCPTAGYAPVHVNPDKLFGRHLAVLGNTGAGKSCTIAGLIRWSLEAAQTARNSDTRNNIKPNARFIILDPNGEYAKAFNDLCPRIFRVEGIDSACSLKIPAWLWNEEEWSAFTRAAPGIQRPILVEAIQKLRSDANPINGHGSKIRTLVEKYHKNLLYKNQISQRTQNTAAQSTAEFLEDMANHFEDLAQEVQDNCNQKENSLYSALKAVADIAREVEKNNRTGGKPSPNSRNPKKESSGQWHRLFSEQEFEEINCCLEHALQQMEPENKNFIADQNTPKFFSVEKLPETIREIAESDSRRDTFQHIDPLIHRIKGLFATGPLVSITDSTSKSPPPPDKPELFLEKWLENYLGGDDQESCSTLSVLDLSFVPSEIMHIVVAVLARMIFEAIQRHRNEHKGKSATPELPTVLVLDEAHRFIHKELTSQSATSASATCCHAFERIAREGRKFGLGLVLASQRPSDISDTVLSQCNTFLLHRIVNDRDQEQVKRFVPDELGDLLRELPSLPSKRAILLGWGSPTPLLTEIRELRQDHRPFSHDPEFWNIWTGATECTPNWNAVSKRWLLLPT